MVVLPHAGGSATSYRPLAQLIGGGAEVWVVQYPARQDRYREPPARSMDELASSVTTALLAADRDQSPLLFGHSMGALLAFEVALRLERSGRGVHHLVVSGRGAPSVPFISDVATGDDDAVIAELIRLDGTDPLILAEPELLALALPVIRADYALVEGWTTQPGAQVACSITVCVGDRDPLLSPEDVARWQDHTSVRPVSVHTFTGGHFYLVEHVETVAAVVRGLT